MFSNENPIVINEDNNKTIQLQQTNDECSKGNHPTLAEIYQKPESQKVKKSSLSRGPPSNPLQEQLERARRRREAVDQPNLFLNRPDFLKRVFCQLYIFSLVAYLNWLAFAKYVKVWDVLMMKVTIAVGCVALCAFILMTIVQTKLRHMFPINWILTIFIIEGSCTVVAFVDQSKNYHEISVTCAVAIGVETFLILMSFCINRNFLPGDWLFYIILCILAGIICLYILLYFMDKLLSYVNFIVAILACTIVITLYHGELICGLRFGLFRKDQLYYSILIYLDFLAFHLIYHHMVYLM